MCWSPEVSLNTFLFSLFGFAFGLYNNYNWRILLVGLVFSSMQFVEYHLWNNLSNPEGNRFWSMIGKYIVWGELFAAANVIQESWLRNVFFGLAFGMLVVHQILGPEKNIITNIGPNGHLQHSWYSKERWFNALFPVMMILPIWLAKEYFWATFITLSAILSAIFYTGREYSSMFCYISTFMWFIVIFQSIGLDKRCLSFLGWK